jgi:hypothetical protein
MPEEYEVFPLMHIPVVMEDEPIHTNEKPYCGLSTCLCVEQAVEDGLLTESEAARYVAGRNV